MAAAVLFTTDGWRGAAPGPDPATDGRAARSADSRRLAWCIRALANVLMLVLVGAFTLVALLPAAGARAMIVLSGSMEPLVSAGDAAIIRDVPVGQLRAGDVITFQPIGADARLTTHRIVDRVELPSGLHFQTQGDANAVPDVDLAPAANVVGRYDGMIPQGGRALLLLNSREAKIGLIALPALCFLVGELRTIAAAVRGRQRTSGWAMPRPAFAAGALVLAAVMGVAVTRATMAVLADVEVVAENHLSTADTF